MTWTNFSFSVGQILTAAQMNNLYANFAALGAGDSGAPEVDEAALAAAVTAQLVTNGDSHNHVGGDGGPLIAGSLGSGAVDTSDAVAAGVIAQANLKSTLQQSSGAVSDGSSVELTLTGGTYSLAYFWDLQTLPGDIQSSDDTSYVAKTRLANNTGSNRTYRLYCRYIQSSPPFNLGNGDIPLFLYAVVDNTTKGIIAVDIAEDPPWFYNGPNRISPYNIFQEKGIKYYRKLITPDVSQALTNQGSFDEYLDALKNPKYQKIEITHNIKNRDMNIVPHPFIHVDLSNKTVCLLDPTGDIANNLRIMKDDNVDVNEIVTNYLNIQNTSISGINSPNGVMVVNVNWKLTR